MWFALLMFLTTLCIAGSAGYLSVIGFATTFQSTFWQAAALAASLEVGKLVGASFLYRYWKTAQATLKAVMVFSIFGLMLFTSAGIYGYLTASYQTSNVTLDTTTTQVSSLEEEKARLQKRKQDIDLQISQLPSNHVKDRQKLMKTFGPELDVLNARLPLIDVELVKIKQSTIQEEAHVGPIIFVAETFGIDKGKAVNWFILLIVCVFDPFAVAMTLATNHAMTEGRKRRDPQPIDLPIIGPIPVTPPTTQAPDTTDVEEEPAVENEAAVPVADLVPVAIPDTRLDTLIEAVGSLNTELQTLTARQKLVGDIRSQANRDL